MRPNTGNGTLWRARTGVLWCVQPTRGGGGGRPPQPPHGHAFAAEDHLREYLVQHLDVIEEGLQLFVDDEENMVSYMPRLLDPMSLPLIHIWGLS